MSAPLSSSVQFSFSNQNSGGSLSLENWNGNVGLGSVALALVDTMPTGSLQLFATVGSVSHAGITGSKHVKASFAQVNGSNKVPLPPGASAISIVFVLSETGEDLSGLAMVSQTASEITFNKKFWGLVKIHEHEQSFAVLKYTPETRSGLSTYGVVAAYKNGNMAIVHVNAMETGTGNDELEVYRIESEMLINGDGEWEKPDGWPDKPSYPNGAKAPRPKVGVISTRVHEVGMVTATGYFYSRTFDIQNQKPYFGDITYVPKKNIVKGSGFSQLSDNMKIKAMEAMTARGKGLYL